MKLQSILAAVVAVTANLCAQSGSISTVFGGYPLGDGLPANRASLVPMHSMAIDNEGRLLLGEFNRLRRVGSDGIMSTILGNGVFLIPPPLLGGAPATATVEPGEPIGMIAMEASRTSGAIYGTANPSWRCSPLEVAAATLIYRFDPPNTVTLVLGHSPCTGRELGDGGPATAGYASKVDSLLSDPVSGDLYFGDSLLHGIRKITAEGKVEAVAGNGTPNADGDGGPAVRAGLRTPLGLALSPERELFIADFGNGRIRRVSAAGVISTFAALPSVRSVRFLKSGKLIASDGFSIWQYSLADSSRQRLYNATAAGRGFIRQILEDRDGTVLVAHDLQVFRLNPDGTDAGLVAGAEGSARANGAQEFARVIWPVKTLVDVNADVWFLDYLGLRRQTPDRTLELLATGLTSFTVDADLNVFVLNSTSLDKFAEGRRIPFVAAAKFNSTDLTDVSVGPEGTLLVTDRQNARIWQVTPAGEVKVFAGGGQGSDGGAASNASLNRPVSTATGPDGAVYIATSGSVRRVAPSGTISTVVTGTGPCAPVETVVAASFGLCNFLSVAVDPNGDLFFATDSSLSNTEHGIYRVRGEMAHRVAGQGRRGLGGDGGLAQQAFLNFPRGVSFAPNADLYISDYASHRIRRVQGFSPFVFNPDRLTLATSLNGPSRTDRIQVRSSDGEPRIFQARIEYPAGRQGWLQVNPESAHVFGDTPVNVDITANSRDLPKGIHSARIIFTDTGEEFAELPVTLLVSGTAQQLRLAQTGFTFVAVQGGPLPQPQQLAVQNAGTGILPFTAAASTLTGGGWLAATPASAVADSRVAVNVNPAGLAPGVYYGLVTIRATVADNAPQSAVVLLQVLGSGETPAPLVDPSGLIVTSSALQTITMGNPRPTAVTYTIAAPNFPDRRTWFQLPAASLTGSIPPGQTARLEIRPQIDGVPPGQYRAQLSIRFAPENIARMVELLLVIADPNPAAADKDRTAGTCRATKLLPVFQQPGGGFTATAAWPQLVQLRVVDDCQDPLVKGRVRVSFNNGDPAVTLTAQPDGVWTGTWAPGRVAARIELSARAESFEPSLLGLQTVAGGLRDDANRPRIVAGGVFSEASKKRTDPVAVGSNITVQGTRMAAAAEKPPDDATTLPPRLGETTVLVGGKPLGLRSAAEGEVHGLVPFTVADATIHQMIVQRGASYSLPEPVLIAPVQPGVYTADGTGIGQGEIYVKEEDREVLSDVARPAIPGEDITIIATGLGAVDPAIPDGAAGGADPISNVLASLRVQIQGVDAAVKSATLIPGKPGRYRIVATVPADLTPDVSARVVLTLAEQAISSPVTMSVSTAPVSPNE